MHRLIDFVNHGVLPFAGRARIIEQIIAFWRGTLNAHEARALLMVGEAGIGKSRILDELDPRLLTDSAIVLRTRLYTDSSTSLVPVLARALRFSDGSPLLREQPEETLPSVLAPLRRLARLRPLLWVIEDVHLLEQEAMHDFMGILEGLADEPVSILAAARPGEFPARAVLSRFLAGEERIGGLEHEDVLAIWGLLFQAEPPEHLIELMLTYTRGNPLAFRTALRNALRAGTIAQDETGGGWNLTVAEERFAGILEEDVRLLSGGMIAHLTDSEKEAAARIAALGETFAGETAARLLGNDSRVLESLLFKGVVARVGPATPLLSGSAGRQGLFAFTHTLIHHLLRADAPVDPDRLLESIIRRDPICTVTPYRLLADHVTDLTVPTEARIEAAEIILRHAPELDASGEWRSADSMVETAGVLLAPEVLPDGDDAKGDREELPEVRLRIMEMRLFLLRRGNHTDRYAELVEAFEKMTREVGGTPARYRLSAYAYGYGQLRRSKDRTGFRAMWEKIEAFLEHHPGLLRTDTYLTLLQVMGRATNVPEDTGMTSVVDRRLRALLADESISDELREKAIREVAPLVLWRFASAEELEERVQLLERLQQVGGESIWVRTRAMAFYDGIGRPDKTLELAEGLVPDLRHRDLRRDLAQVRLFRLYALALQGAPLERIAEDVEDVIGEAPTEIREAIGISLANRFAGIGLMRGRPDWAAEMVNTYGREAALHPQERLALALYRGEWNDVLNDLRDDGHIRDVLGRSSVNRLSGGDAEPDSVINDLTDRFNSPIYIRGHLLDLHLRITAVRLLEEQHGIHIPETVVALAVRRQLEWLAERDLWSTVPPLIGHAGEFLTDADRTEWEKRTKAAPARGGSVAPTERDRRVEISMIGEIAVRASGHARSRVRGSRLRMLLGLLTVNELLPRPLSYREFCRIASGGEEEQERARKMSSMGLLRLRETYGENLLTTIEGESPRLNPAEVRVDLLEMVELLRRAGEEVRNGALVRAHTHVIHALDLFGGDVPFPALYDDFFEAARDDVDHILRETVLSVVRGLLEEGDAMMARLLLGPAVNAIPHDDELADLLERILIDIGEHTEAERLRLRRKDDDSKSA